MFKEKFENGVVQQNPNDEKKDNIYGIIQGALFCKGYSTGSTDITCNFYSGTGNAIKKLTDIKKYFHFFYLLKIFHVVLIYLNVFVEESQI